MPILIGLVTLAGAGLTWRSLDLAGQASDGDRRAVLDTIAQQRAELYAEGQVRFEGAQFARYRATRVAAEEHRDAADAAAAAADDATATQLRRTAEALDAQAAVRAATGAVRLEYVTGTEAEALSFDADRRRSDLVRQNPYFEATSVDPAFTRAQADELHDRSLAVVLAIVALTGVGALLTVAEFLSGRPRTGLAALGAVVAVVVTAAALAGPGY